MADTDWTGNTSNDYTVSTNWDDGLPVAGNNGVFGPFRNNQSIALGSGPQDVGGWVFNGGAYTITVTNTSVQFEGVGVQVNAGIPTISVSGSLSSPDVQLFFANHSDGGGAAYNLGDFGIINFSADSNSNVSLGSINCVFGSGIAAAGGTSGIVLSNQQLTIGSNGLSSSIAGFIGNGTAGNSNALVKVGGGTLTLTATEVSFNVTSMTVDAGVLDIGGTSAYMPSGLSAGVSLFAFGHSGATLAFEDAALPGSNLSVPIHGVDWGDAIDLPGLAFKQGATAEYDPASHFLLVTNGSTTDTFNDVEGSANRYFALSDQDGGTRIMLAIIESRSHKHLDSKHAPPGQPAPSQPGQLLVALGKNDVVKGVGGNNILVGGAHNDVLFAAAGDTFAFVSLDASPPGKYHDTITHYQRHHGEKIDLSAFDVGGEPLVFMHGSFKAYSHKHHTLGMVRVEHIDASPQPGAGRDQRPLGAVRDRGNRSSTAPGRLRPLGAHEPKPAGSGAIRSSNLLRMAFPRSPRRTL